MTELLVFAIALLLVLSSAGDAMATGPVFLPDPFPTHGSLRPEVYLGGEWQFRCDPGERGVELGWHRGEGRFGRKLTVPGAPQAQGIGESNGSQKHFLDEPFWVRRRFEAPAIHPGQRVWLRLGEVLPAAEVYLNGHLVGYTKSSRTPQRVDVTDFLDPGRSNLIAIKVCRWPDVKLEGIWEWAEARRLWTGIYRPIKLEVTGRVCVTDVYAQPVLASSSVRVALSLSEASQETLPVTLTVRDGNRVIGHTQATIGSGALQAEAEVALTDFSPWSPNHPKLYRLEVALGGAGKQARDRVAMRFGMREIVATRDKFLLNGKPLYLRCFGDDQLYPETLAPPTDKQWYLSRFRRARAYGLNAAKSCEEIFSPDYLEAADEAGLLIIQEMPFGLSGYVRINQHQLEQPWRDFYGQELEGLVRVSRNHPSVIAYSMCSEVPLDGGTQEAFDFFCRQCPQTAQRLAPHALVIDNTGYHGNEQTPRGERITDFYAQVIPTWCKDALDEPAIPSDGRHPTILHEYNWWSCYPDPKDRRKYDQAAIIPWWLDVLEKSAADAGLTDLVPTFRRNSLWLQALCRKDGLEYARRCPNVEGFILWLLIDFGQYTEGVFDDFWQPKNVSARELLQSTADTVIVLAEEGNRCFPAGERVSVPLAVSHYGEEELAGCTVTWEAVGSGLQTSGKLRVAELPLGELTQVGAAELALPAASHGLQFELRVALRRGDEVLNTNQWTFWALPETPAALPEGPGVMVRSGADRAAPISPDTALVIADTVDQALTDYLVAGGKCLLLSKGSAIEEPETYYQGYTTYRTIPWNGAPGNSGTVIADHPALAEFPHGSACDLNFAWLIKKVHPLNLGELRAHGVQPIIRGIDFYQTNKHLTYLTEFGVGQGKVLVTSLNLLPKLSERLEARYLLQCLAQYAQSPRFAPIASVPPEAFQRLLRPKAEKQARQPRPA